MFEDNAMVGVEPGEQPRDDRYIQFYYPAVDPLRKDNWVNTIGPKAFIAWLQLLTLVDRSRTALEKYNNITTVPRSIENLAKLLGMSKPTFYKQVLKPLWNYGLIDIVEWKAQKKIGQKAYNIVVYLYPKNEFSRINKPLVKLRDYDTDYHSQAKVYAQRAANIAAEKRGESTPVEKPNPHLLVFEQLRQYHIKPDLIDQVADLLSGHRDKYFTLDQVETQLLHMNDKINNGERIFDFALYFVNGLMRLHEVGDSLDAMKATKLAVPVAEITRPNFLSYNWLLEREA